MNTRVRQLLVCVGILAATALASRGLLSALAHDKLMSGHDATGYGIYVTEFHDNLVHGNLVPVWAQHLRFGYGEPHLEFRPPLENYLAEFWYDITGNLFAALNLTCISFLLSAAIGMYFLVRLIVALLARAGEAATPAEQWAPLFACAAFVLSPYVLVDTYVRGAYSEASCFSVLPWFAWAFLRLAVAPTKKRLAAAAAVYALFAMSHSGIHLFTLPFFLAAVFYYRHRIKSVGRLFLAVALGLSASSFSWLTSVIESKYVKIPLMLVDFESYVAHFVRLDQLVYTSFFEGPGGLNFAVGALTLFGMAFYLWNWATAQGASARFRKETWRLCTLLFCFCVVCVFFMHRVSAVWYELLPPLQIMSFPWRFLTIFTFFGALLGTLALLQISRSPRVLIGFLALLISYAYAHTAPFGYQSVRQNDFTGESLISHGWGWAKPQLTPSTAGIIPQARAENTVEVVQGRADLRCERQGPTAMECEAMAIQTTTLRFNLLHYAGWKTLVDGQLVTTSIVEPIRGTPAVTIPPGKHVVRWELRDTPVRTTMKVLSFLSWFLILVVLFQDQLAKGKSLFPKRKESREQGSPA